MVLSEQAMREKMRQGGSTAPGLSQGQPMMADPGGGALPAAQPAWHPPMAPPTQSALPASPSGQPNGATPASGGQPSGGAGNSTTPTDLLTKTDPETVLKSAETSAKAAAKSGATDDSQADQQKKQLAESMAAQGMDPVKAYNELKDQYMTALDQRHESGEITRKQHSKMKDRWKNIFNVVPEEDFGLFLMDFGLRLAAHSASNSFGGAFGAAGVEALGGVQQRKAADQKAALDRDELAHKRALEGVGMRQKERELDIYEKRAVGSGGPATESTDKGLMFYNPETKQWEPIKHEGEVVHQTYAGDRGYQGEKFWMKNQLQGSNLSESEINNLLLGAKTPQERAQVLQDTLGKLKTEYAAKDSSGKFYRDYNREDEARWIADMMRAADDAVSQYRAPQKPSGVLPPPTATPAPEPEPEPEKKRSRLQRLFD